MPEKPEAVKVNKKSGKQPQKKKSKSSRSGSSNKREIHSDDLRESDTSIEWDDADPNKVWPVEAVVDHYICPFTGEKWYKVAWDSWQRADGSNTTWVRPSGDVPNDLKRRYEISLQKDRQNNIDVGVPEAVLIQQPWLSRATIASKYMSSPFNRDERPRVDQGWKDHVAKITLRQRQAEGSVADQTATAPVVSTAPPPTRTPRIAPPLPPPPPPPVVPTVVQSRAVSTIAPPRTAASSATPSMTLPPPTAPSTPIRYEETWQEPTQSKESSDVSQIPSKKLFRKPSFSKKIQEKLLQPSNFSEVAFGYSASRCTRDEIQAQWSAVVDLASAAPVTIVPHISTDRYSRPSLPVSFKYLEAEFEYYTPELNPAYRSSNIAIGCFCLGSCDTTIGERVVCGCQADSTFKDKEFAYTQDGLFRFNNQREGALEADAEVWECTQLCACDFDCPNRTSQQSRDIPIQVFNTVKYGWGVRPLRDLLRGKVLGLFTGKVIPREVADSLEAKRRSDYVRSIEKRGSSVAPLDARGYIFDLDAREDLSLSDNEHSTTTLRYSVDSWSSGNWTRFLNHSCDPNCMVYTAIADPMPDSGDVIGRHVIVATRPVKAMEELTIDYRPSYQHLMDQDGQDDDDSGMTQVPCRCGTVRCRGYIHI